MRKVSPYSTVLALALASAPAGETPGSLSAHRNRAFGMGPLAPVGQAESGGAVPIG